MLVSPILASEIVAPLLFTVAATATIAHWCLIRTNFS